MLASGERLAVVTDGARGSAAAGLAIRLPLVREASATRIPSVDATGAGDAFTASLLASLSEIWPPSADVVAAALERAADAGAVATTALGAQATAIRNATGSGA